MNHHLFIELDNGEIFMRERLTPSLASAASWETHIQVNFINKRRNLRFPDIHRIIKWNEVRQVWVEEL